MRTLLLVCLVVAAIGGCVSPTGGPPPFPQPSFEYTHPQDGGGVTITATGDGGVDGEPIRILVGETTVYANGSFQGAYEAIVPIETIYTPTALSSEIFDF